MTMTIARLVASGSEDGRGRSVRTYLYYLPLEN